LRKLVASFRLLRYLARETGKLVAEGVERGDEFRELRGGLLQPFAGNVSCA
jgi:hypothetical protein